MRLDELIEKLEADRAVLGNVEIVIQGLRIDKDGSVDRASPVSALVYQHVGDGEDVKILFERIIYE